MRYFGLWDANWFKVAEVVKGFFFFISIAFDFPSIGKCWIYVVYGSHLLLSVGLNFGKSWVVSLICVRSVGASLDILMLLDFLMKSRREVEFLIFLKEFNSFHHKAQSH